MKHLTIAIDGRTVFGADVADALLTQIGAPMT
jgi:hypothetical protein